MAVAAAGTAVVLVSGSSVTPLEVWEGSLAATRSASSFHFVESGKTSRGFTSQLDLTVGPNGGYGTLDLDGSTSHLLQLGHTIFGKRPGEYADKWTKVPSNEPLFKGHPSIFTLQQLANVGDPPKTSFTTMGSSMLDGQQVTVLHEKLSSGWGTAYVATHGPPYLLRNVLQYPKTPGALRVVTNLSDFNAPLRIRLPAGVGTK